MYLYCQQKLCDLLSSILLFFYVFTYIKMIPLHPITIPVYVLVLYSKVHGTYDKRLA
jgi:hypothetical protein